MTQSRRVGYAVVGIGHISQRAILPAFQHAKKCRLIALISADIAKAERLAKQFGASQFCTYAEIELCLANPEVEAIYIATPNSTHLAFALLAAAHGKHVLCEKPLANTPAECLQMIDACRKHGVRLMTAYRKYFEPSTLACKKLLAYGKLGKLRLIHTSFTNNLPANAGWHTDATLAGGGALMDLGIYCVNTPRWLTGQEPSQASAQSWTSDPARFANVEENVSFQLEFPDALRVVGSASFTAAKSSFIHVHGEKGWATLDPAYAYNEEHRLFGKLDGKWFEKTFPPVEEFHLEMDHFATCIRKGLEPEPDGVTGLRDVAIIHAIYQAAKTQRPAPIHLPL